MFIGRAAQYRELLNLKAKKAASLAVIKGRRRIGKSSLAAEIGKSFNNFIRFEGVFPQAGTTNETQLRVFARQYSRNFDLPEVKFNDWSEAFSHLAKQTSSGESLILLDEISWMGSKDPNFAGLLKIAWDQQFKNNAKLIMILCGSVSAWIEHNILQHTQFLGRISLVIRLKELTLNEIAEFWGRRLSKASPTDILKLLTVIGGVPKYLEEVDLRDGADANIKRLCFNSSGYLYNDFGNIFSDVFGTRSKVYLNIVKCLVSEQLTAAQLARKSKVALNGRLLQYLSDLEESGFIARYPLNNLASAKSDGFRYRLADNYLRFYLKYIEPNKSQISENMYKFASLSQLLNWDSLVGIQFEGLVLNRIPEIIEALNLTHEVFIAATPFIQTKAARREACQIDLLLTTKSRVHYLCEIKFKKYISGEVIKEVEKKIKNLKLPKNHAIRPVLIYAGELDSQVLETDYFDRILDLASLLQVG